MRPNLVGFAIALKQKSHNSVFEQSAPWGFARNVRMASGRLFVFSAVARAFVHMEHKSLSVNRAAVVGFVSTGDPRHGVLCVLVAVFARMGSTSIIVFLVVALASVSTTKSKVFVHNAVVTVSASTGDARHGVHSAAVVASASTGRRSTRLASATILFATLLIALNVDIDSRVHKLYDTT